MFGKAWFSVLPYVALVGLVTVATRSSATGMAVGLGYYFFEQIFVGIFINLFDWFQRAAEFPAGLQYRRLHGCWRRRG